jgi:hypothetical protein
MPSAILTDVGLLTSLTDRLRARLFLRLFRNNAPVLPGSMIGDFQEALFPGYADLELTSLWPVVDFDLFGRALSRVNATFTRGAGGLQEFLYGWILYELPAPDSFLIGGRNFSPPQFTALAGDKIQVQLSHYALKG